MWQCLRDKTGTQGWYTVTLGKCQRTAETKRNEVQMRERQHLTAGIWKQNGTYGVTLGTDVTKQVHSGKKNREPNACGAKEGTLAPG